MHIEEISFFLCSGIDEEKLCLKAFVHLTHISEVVYTLKECRACDDTRSCYDSCNVSILVTNRLHAEDEFMLDMSPMIYRT